MLVCFDFFLPKPVKTGVKNVLYNLGEPVVMFNHLFQGKRTKARRNLLRFILNSTLGVAGLFDVARALGVDPAPTSFNQTLKGWGVPVGPYIVWPVLGPLSVRDGMGMMVDFFMDPFNLIAMHKGWDARLYRSYLYYINERHHTWLSIESLKKSSIDPYVMVRSLYYQARHN